MSSSMTAAPSGLQAVPSAFAAEFAHAMIAAKLVTPLARKTALYAKAKEARHIWRRALA